MPSPNDPHSPTGKPINPPERSIFWGGQNIPISEATTHFLVAGATSSGKTITTRMLMQSVLKHIGLGLNSRALIYDTRCDMYSLLAGMDLRCQIQNLNPFDQRGAAWDIAADVNSPAAAQQLAAVLVPKDTSSQSFFVDAARQLLCALCEDLINRAPGKWTLRDILLATQSRERILSVFPPTHELAQLYAHDGRTFQNTLSTLQAKLHPLEEVAETWDHAKQKIQLQAWLENESVLLLGNDPVFDRSLEPINQAIFQCLETLILRQPDSTTRRTWMFFDDLSSPPRLDCLPALLQQGRSKGACILITMQNIESIRHLYGLDIAHELIASCMHKTVLRLDDRETAQWAEQTFGPPAFAFEIRKLPLTGPAHGFCAFHNSPSTGTYFMKKPWDWVLANLNPPKDNLPN